MCFFDKFKVSSTLWKLCIVFWLLLGITKIITWDIPESVGRSLILRFQAICEDYFLKFNNLGKHIAHSRLKMGGKYNSNVVYQWLQSFFSVPFSLDPPWMGPKFWVLSRPVLFFGSHLPWAPLKCTFFLQILATLKHLGLFLLSFRQEKVRIYHLTVCEFELLKANSIPCVFTDVCQMPLW